MRVRSHRIWGVLLLVLLLVLWQVSALCCVASTNWPPVTEILKAIIAGMGSGELAQVFGSTLWRMAAGFAIGSAAGMLLGITMATFPLADAALRSVVELLRPIPMPAIVPPLILLLGIDHAMHVIGVLLARRLGAVLRKGADQVVFLEDDWRRVALRVRYLGRETQRSRDCEQTLKYR